MYQIISDSTNFANSTEDGKETVNHDGVKQWHYFATDIIVEELTGEREPYTVFVDVKEKDNGSFVYTYYAINEEKSAQMRSSITIAAHGGSAEVNRSKTTTAASDALGLSGPSESKHTNVNSYIPENTDSVKQDSAVKTYLQEMETATNPDASQAALNGMVSNLFVRAEKGWLAEHPDVDLDASVQKFAGALKSYMRGEMALENALKKAGFDAQPYEMNTALSYAGRQLLLAEGRGLGGDVQYQIKQVNFTPEKIDENIAYVANMKPVKALRGDEFSMGGKDLVANVAQYFAGIGGSVYNEELGDVELTKKGIKTDISHGLGRNKAASFQAVDAVIREGRVIDFEEKWKGRPYDTAVVAAPIRIGTQDYYMGVIVKRSSVQTFYVHEVILQEKSATGSRSTIATGNAPGFNSGTNHTMNSVLEKLNSVNTENPDSVKAQAEEFSDKDTQWSIRKEAPPKKTIKGYKVFVVFKNKPGQLYPPMVANPGGESTPVGVWLNADVGVQAPDSKTGRKQVKAGGKGTQGGSGSLAFRPGWHLGDMPKATQFNRLNPETGVKELFPENFVWAECECAADHDYQEEAMSYGYNANGKFQHALAGLPRLPREAGHGESEAGAAAHRIQR